MSIQQRSRIGGIGQPLNEKLMVADINEIVTELNNLPEPLTPNPTSGFYPINRDGVFANSGLSDAYGSFGPFPPTGLKFYDSFTNSALLNISPLDVGYTFGQAFYDQFGVVASSGISINGMMNQMVMNCGISPGSNGIFKANGITGIVRIGASDNLGIGAHLFNGSLFVGAGLMTSSSPSGYNPNTPYRFIRLTNEWGERFVIPVWEDVPPPPPGGGGGESGVGGGSESGFGGGSE
jgi:hypothetical protein